MESKTKTLELVKKIDSDGIWYIVRFKGETNGKWFRDQAMAIKYFSEWNTIIESEDVLMAKEISL